MRFDKDQRPVILYLSFLLGMVIFVILYTVAGFWVLPRVAQALLEKHLTRTFRRPVTIERIEVNPYELSFAVKGFTVWDQNATSSDQNGTSIFLAFDELFAVVQGGSLVEHAPILREVKLDGLYVGISRKPDGRFNFSDLLEASASEPLREGSLEAASRLDGKASTTASGTPAEKPRIVRFSVHNVRIMNGTVDYFDEAKGERQRIANLGLDLPLVSSLGETQDGVVELTVKAKLNESPLAVVARGKPFIVHPEWAVAMELKALSLVDYVAYLRPAFQMKVRSGLVEAKADLTYVQEDNGTLLNIFGEAGLTDFEVVDRNEAPLIKLPEVTIGLASFEPLEGRMHLSRVLIQAPDLTLSRDRDGILNVQKLITADRTKGEADNAGKEKAPFHMAIDAIDLADGRIGVTDHAVAPAFHTVLEKLNLSIKGFTTAPGSKAAIAFDVRTDDNETIGMEGTLAATPLLWEGRMNVAGLKLAKYAPYYHKQILFDVLDGQLGVAASVRVAAQGKDVELGVTNLASSLTALKLKKSGETENFLEIPHLQIKGLVLNLAEKAATIAELSSQTAKLSAIRDNNGELNLQHLMPVSPEAVADKASEPATPRAGATPWKVLLQRLTLNDYAIRFEDRMMAEPVAFLVDQIRLEGRDLAADPEGKPHFTLSCRVNEGGSVRVEGDLKPSPLFADFKLNLENLELPPVQPYIPPDIRVKIKEGKLSAAGNLLLARAREGDLNTSYVGNVMLTDFSSADTLAGEPFMGWKSLEMKGVDAGNNPIRAGIKRIDWKNFFTRIAISAEGKINLLQVLGSETEAKAAGATNEAPKAPGVFAKAAPKGRETPRKPDETTRPKPQATPSEKKAEQAAIVTIDQIALQNGTISFSDSLIKPNVHAQMFDVGGTISGLSSKKDKLADVNLRGKLYRSSPLEITGKLRPFADDLYADLNVTFKNIDMTRWDPYARKYVGYTLDKGNLQMELKYLLAKRKLDALNNIVLDRLTLGEKVDSPDATTLPVKFAISLLQDRKGQIELGIPVSGDLDDPKFGFGSAILSFLKNLVMKAVTAPFALLGVLLPQGVGELDRIEMTDVGGTISEAGMKKLEALAKVLQDRPNLELDLQGTIQSESGKELLRQQLFENKLKAQKLKELMKKGGTAVALDQVTMAPDEAEKALKLAYDEEFPKEGLDRIRIFKKTPPDEMKARLLSTVQVSEEDTRVLAYDWALRVKDYLQETGKIEARRLFLLEPSVVGVADQGKFKGNGVDLKLK